MKTIFYYLKVKKISIFVYMILMIYISLILYHFYMKQPHIIFANNLTFLIDYFTLRIAECQMSWTQAQYLTKIFKTIPFHDLLQFVSKEEIKLYVDNLIQTYENLENEIYPSIEQKLKDIQKEKMALLNIRREKFVAGLGIVVIAWIYGGFIYILMVSDLYTDILTSGAKYVSQGQFYKYVEYYTKQYENADFSDWI